MKSITRIIPILLVLIPAVAGAEPYRGFALGLFDPAQFPDRERDVHGVRLSLVYSRHHDLFGADIGGILWPFSVNRLDGELRGAQSGLANSVAGNMAGAQFGAFNRVGGRATGFQGGILNISNDTEHFLGQWGIVNITAQTHHGAQVGILNHAHRVVGAQVGFVNHAVELDGVQVGLINLRQRPAMNMPDASPTVFPIVTWSF